MMTIRRVIENETCLFCCKQKEVAAVQIDGQSEVLLCWSDVRKMAHMHMRMNGKPDARSIQGGTTAAQPTGSPK